ncbi:hypothetical protein BDV93DRAFT_478396 [Ceratobasidium sp. AG-I]|nr:hypothetical protein BDV93DRAFT_478396 [Ceratobasidium sp. AG-I]
MSIVKGLSFPSSRQEKNSGQARHVVPQSGQVLLITDTPASSSQFLLHALLQSQLKRETDPTNDAPTCILVSVDHDLAHISAIASRSNLNLHTCLRNRTLVFVDALSRTSHPPGGLAADPDAPESPATPGIVVCPPLADSLLPLYDVIRRAFSELTRGPALLVLGDLSTLEWIGVSSTELTRFVRAVRALAVQNQAGLVVTYHSPSAQLPIGLPVLRDLVLCADVHAEVRELSSGLSSAVSGEVALHPGFTAHDPLFVPIPREQALQYRLTDGSAIWFERGTSAGVL